VTVQWDVIEKEGSIGALDRGHENDTEWTLISLETYGVLLFVECLFTLLLGSSSQQLSPVPHLLRAYGQD